MAENVPDTMNWRGNKSLHGLKKLAMVVSPGEILAEVETDKLRMELES